MGVFDGSEIIIRQLKNDEKLYWSGQPASGIKLKGFDVFLIPFSLMWSGMIIEWEITAFSSGAPFYFKAIGIPFVLVALYLLLGRFLVDAKIRSKTFYGITNKRILIVTGLFSLTVTSFQLGSLTELSLNTKSNGTGTITFGSQDPRYSMFGTPALAAVSQRAEPVFYLIPDVAKVYEIIRENQEKLKA